MMENFVRLIGVLYGILIICTLPGSQVDGALDVTPVDTAVLDGQSAVLRCHSNFSLSAAVSWSRRVAGGTDEQIVIACDLLPTLKPTLSSVYSLISDGVGQCDLVVNRTDTSLTGLYTCTESSIYRQTAEAHLTIIDEDVHMSQSPDFVLEGDQLNISCEVGYSGTLAPDFIWHPTPYITLPAVDTGSSVNSTVQVTVPSFPHSVQSYTCYVRFSGSVFPSSANQTSTPVKTSVCVKTATISGLANTSSVDADTVINCTADVKAYPPASYIWTNDVDNSLSDGFQFTLRPGTQYKLTCTASNNFNRCNATNYVEFNTTGVPPTTAEPSQSTLPPGSSTSTAPSGASTLSPGPRPGSDNDNLPLILGLSLGIGVPVLLLIFILLLCCCCECCPWYRKCRKRGVDNGRRDLQNRPIA